MDIKMDETAFQQKLNEVYAERNALVAALSKIYPAWLERHPMNEEWEEDWRWIVFIEIPTKELVGKYQQGGVMIKFKRQLSWHIHDSELDSFAHLQRRITHSWDGHSTAEKYRRLQHIKP